MEANTVILHLDDYNHLRDFKKTIEDGNTVKFCEGYIYFITTNQAIKEAGEINAELIKENNELKFDEQIYADNIKELKELINDLKKKSLWQLYKWWEHSR